MGQQQASDRGTPMTRQTTFEYDRLIDDLERIRLKLRVEAALHSEQTDLGKKLRNLAFEADDALIRFRQLLQRDDPVLS